MSNGSPIGRPGTGRAAIRPSPTLVVTAPEKSPGGADAHAASVLARIIPNHTRCDRHFIVCSSKF